MASLAAYLTLQQGLLCCPQLLAQAVRKGAHSHKAVARLRVQEAHGVEDEVAEGGLARGSSRISSLVWKMKVQRGAWPPSLGRLSTSLMPTQQCPTWPPSLGRLSTSLMPERLSFSCGHTGKTTRAVTHTHTHKKNGTHNTCAHAQARECTCTGP